MGVSIDTSPPSQVDLAMQAAFERGTNFMTRLALADAKAAHDEALAELNLGKSAKAALDDAQRKQSDAQAKLDEADATLETAKQTAAETTARAEQTAAALVAKARSDADALTAEAARIHGDAQRDKDGAATDRAAATAERSALRVEREAAKRLAEEAETAQAAFQAKTDRLHVVLAELGASAPGTASPMGTSAN